MADFPDRPTAQSVVEWRLFPIRLLPDGLRNLDLNPLSGFRTALAANWVIWDKPAKRRVLHIGHPQSQIVIRLNSSRWVGSRFGGIGLKVQFNG